MSLTHLNRCLAAGIAAGALVFAAQAVLAADGGTVTGVVSDASGRPVSGAFVKLKNDQRRLTFMVISRDQGRFEAKDLPPGQYRVQGVAGDNQSQWFSNVAVTAGGEDAKVGLFLNEKRGPDLAPAWPQRVPEEQVDKTPKDETGLPQGTGPSTRRRALRLLPRPAARARQALRRGRLDAYHRAHAHPHDGRRHPRPLHSGEQGGGGLSLAEIPAGAAL